MLQFEPIEYQKQRIFTAELLAYVYETEPKVISNNFNRNKNRYQEGKHFYCLQGEDLRAFRSIHQIDEYSKNIPKLYLWTQRGALLMPKL